MMKMRKRMWTWIFNFFQDEIKFFVKIAWIQSFKFGLNSNLFCLTRFFKSWNMLKWIIRQNWVYQCNIWLWYVTQSISKTELHDIVQKINLKKIFTRNSKYQGHVSQKKKIFKFEFNLHHITPLLMSKFLCFWL